MGNLNPLIQHNNDGFSVNLKVNLKLFFPVQRGVTEVRTKVFLIEISQCLLQCVPHQENIYLDSWIDGSSEWPVTPLSPLSTTAIPRNLAGRIPVDIFPLKSLPPATNLPRPEALLQGMHQLPLSSVHSFSKSCCSESDLSEPKPKAGA
jgi:hypothetical protein